jgi:hypothetical protein
MEQIIGLIIIGIWGSIVLIGMTLIKLEREKTRCWIKLDECCNCEDNEVQEDE